MSSLARSSTLGACALGLLLGAAGCSKPDPQQVVVVQEMATALARPGSLGLRAACQNVVPEQQNPMGCDNVLVPLLHYAPGFGGSTLSRRGPSHGGGLLGRGPVTVPLRYQGKNGSGNLDVTMQLIEGKWRIFGLIPAS